MVAADHPRVCGEKKKITINAPEVEGSPPRMRGKAGPRETGTFQPGITPAYAGKSRFWLGRKNPSGDHPRVCGEKSPQGLKSLCRRGSPPRMRGKESRAESQPHQGGITPAYAGKSLIESVFNECVRDHPRVCGEKSIRILRMWERTGSPPRMRGKVFSRRSGYAWSRITPAYAGKSHSLPRVLKPEGDHPRVCGEKPTLAR